MTRESLPEGFDLIVGELAAPAALDPAAPYPFETLSPVSEGYMDRNGVKLWYAVWGDRGPWLAFAPPFQVVHTALLKAVVPYLSQHFRVLTTDGRGNGRSDRPNDRGEYSFDLFHGDFAAVLDAAGVDRAALIGISAAAMTVIRQAAERPDRVSHLVVAGGFADSRVPDEATARQQAAESRQMREDWPAYLDAFITSIFSEPHSTKAYEDGVRYGWATRGEVIDWCRDGWTGHSVKELARRIACPTLVIHGDQDARVVYARGWQCHELIPGSELLTIAGGGHVPAVRDPVLFCRAVREFLGARPRRRTWVRGASRRRRALFLSSPIGLGHAQRDLAIARELRKISPDLKVDWFTVDPAARYLGAEGESIHPACARLANESSHFERVAGEHDLSAFFALRSMDEIMTRNFMTFLDVVEAEHYDLVVGDEAWDVDYYYHENPETKRQPFVFLTDFVGCLPMNGADAREALLCADRNAEDLAHVARYPYIRDAALFIGNPEDVTTQTFGAGLPGIRDWTGRNFHFCGYALPFDPAALADTDRLRARLGYSSSDRLVIASVGGTSVGRHLLERIVESFPLMRRELPGLRLVLVTGPRLSLRVAAVDGLEVRPYVHNLYEHLACCDLALVQGGLSTCMELVATRRRFLSFPLQNHFEQCVHVRQRLANYGADRAVDYRELDPKRLAARALEALHEPVRYAAVETDGAARAARAIAEVLENRRGVTST
jgi:pimeloyl-ACP methyl ester carboxylesterase/predicted glycosyltransferase